MSIVHREFCFDVNSTSIFNPIAIPIQPGSTEMTRWLANIAPWFESYTLNALSFEYVPSISTGRDGRLILGADYDANDSPPTDIHVLENMGDNASGSVWAPLTLRCNPANLHKMVRERYIRSGPRKPNQDVTTTDCGVFYLAIDGADPSFDGHKMGAIYVTYSITLRTPQVHDTPAASLAPHSYFCQAPITLASTASGATAELLSAYAAYNATSFSRWGDGSLLNTNSQHPFASNGIKLTAGYWVLDVSGVCTVTTGPGPIPILAHYRSDAAGADLGFFTIVRENWTSMLPVGTALGTNAGARHRMVLQVTQTSVDAGASYLHVTFSNPLGLTLASTAANIMMSIHPLLSESPTYGAHDELKYADTYRMIKHILEHKTTEPDEKATTAKTEPVEHKREHTEVPPARGYFF